ncbi:MAG: hypothetical protein GXP34_05165 [Actinobacteria bacterium]|nr:hypothetical protein [Actinomycetota bacterium]
MPRDFAALAVAAMTLSTVISACTPATSPTRSAPPAAVLTAAEQRSLARVERDLVNVDYFTSQEVDVVAEAKAELEYRCLRNAGIDWRPPGPSDIPDTPNPLNAIRPPDLWLHQDGPIGLATPLAEPGTLDTFLSSLRSADSAMQEYPPAPPGWEDAEFGNPRREITIDIGGGGSVTVPVSGCAGQVVEQLYGVDAAAYHRTRTAAIVASKVLDQVVGNESVADATRRWSTCMHRQGYRVATPDDLYELFQSDFEGLINGTRTIADLSETDAAVGAADAECKTQSGLATTFARTLIDVGEERLRRNEGVLAAYAKYREEGLERAAAIVGGSFPDDVDGGS